jgi:hypothetical protein
MIEWSDQKVDEQEVAIFFIVMQKMKKKKNSRDGFYRFLQISQIVVW